MKIGNEWSGVICKTQLINVVNAFVLNKAIHSTIVNLTIALFQRDLDAHDCGRTKTAFATCAKN